MICRDGDPEDGDLGRGTSGGNWWVGQGMKLEGPRGGEKSPFLQEKKGGGHPSRSKDLFQTLTAPQPGGP